ncbi:CHAT domain-containing protein, partial [Mycena leptocephala]
PKPYKDLCNVSKAGPVVILNSHEHSCDGMVILNPNLGPVLVSLSVTLNQLQSQKALLKELLARCDIRMRESESSRLFGQREVYINKTPGQCFKELLDWLWTDIVAPVYHILALHGIDSGRLWWLPTGAFTGLPLHACSPADQFIQSYTATIGSLLKSHTKKPGNSNAKVGVIGVTHTGLARDNFLPGVEKEVKNILSVIPKPYVVCLEGQQATVNAVKKQLQDCSWLHLACHGKQDLVKPTKSHLVLYDGTLELETILQMPLSNAEVVFLAACQTAMGASELINESFHLGGGFIAAGFRGAIGTMWSMNDQDGPEVAEVVYSHLFRDGQQPQAGDAAEALQLAVRELRKRNVPYERWIPFIHMGV